MRGKIARDYLTETVCKSQMRRMTQIKGRIEKRFLLTCYLKCLFARFGFEYCYGEILKLSTLKILQSILGFSFLMTKSLNTFNSERYHAHFAPQPELHRGVGHVEVIQKVKPRGWVTDPRYQQRLESRR